MSYGRGHLGTALRKARIAPSTRPARDLEPALEAHGTARGVIINVTVFPTCADGMSDASHHRP